MTSTFPVPDNPFIDPVSETGDHAADGAFGANATLAVGRNASLTLGTDSLIVLGKHQIL